MRSLRGLWRSLFRRISNFGLHSGCVNIFETIVLKDRGQLRAGGASDCRPHCRLEAGVDEMLVWEQDVMPTYGIQQDN